MELPGASASFSDGDRPVESMKDSLADFGWKNFWDICPYSQKTYIGRPVTRDMIDAVEQEFGYKLPAAYVQLLEVQNGGIPNNTCCPTNEPTSWAEDHCAITGIYGIDPSKQCSLLGSPIRSDFWISEWGYPDVGLYICDCPSAGHDMIALDYTHCGPTGEARVVHIDQERDYQTTVIASTFAEFIRKLLPEDEFEIA